jgi:hypothetical protein
MMQVPGGLDCNNAAPAAANDDNSNDSDSTCRLQLTTMATTATTAAPAAANDDNGDDSTGNRTCRTCCQQRQRIETSLSRHSPFFDATGRFLLPVVSFAPFSMQRGGRNLLVVSFCHFPTQRGGADLPVVLFYQFSTLLIAFSYNFVIYLLNIIYM